MPEILCIGGSPRKGGNADILITHFLKGAGAGGITAEAVQLRDCVFQSCTGCEKCRRDKACTGLQDAMQSVYPKIIEAGGLILVSPVHHYNVTAMMKAFIDRLYCFYDFDDTRPGSWSSRLANQGRKAVIAVAAEQKSLEDSGADLALKAMRLPLEALGYEVIGELPVTGIFARGQIAEHPEILERAEEMGRRLGEGVGR